VREEQTQLAGIGIRYDFVTDAGDRIGVLLTDAGERELLFYDRDDPDSCLVTVPLGQDEASRLAELLVGLFERRSR
jgi:TrkA domain protein